MQKLTLCVFFCAEVKRVKTFHLVHVVLLIQQSIYYTGRTGVKVDLALNLIWREVNFISRAKICLLYLDAGDYLLHKSVD